MNNRARPTPADTHPRRPNADTAAQLPDSKISQLLAECLEEAKDLYPSSCSELPVPLTRDLGAHGPFTVVCKLATSSTAIVYLAVDQREICAERLVAVKQYLPTITQGPEFSARFTRQLSVASMVNHRSVCKLLDYGTTGSSYYTATEFLQGEPLSSVITAPALRDAANRSPRLIAHLIANFADGLHALHAIKGAGKPAPGYVTPDNLFVLYDGQVRVTNFGTAWIRDLSPKRSASDESYLSPEQLEGSVHDGRADIWALGVVLWELLTGEKLFQCTTNLEAVVEILARQIPSPAAGNPQVSSELEHIVLKALARDPKERYRSARELSLDLEDFIARSGGPVARTEVVAWLTRLFPNGVDRCLGLLELAATVTKPRARFADSSGSAPPVSYAYTPAAEDNGEHTTQIGAPQQDEGTLRSLEFSNPPMTLRGPKANAQRGWRETFAPLAAGFALVLCGFFAGHAAFSRARIGASASAPAVELEQKRSASGAAPLAAAFALKQTTDQHPFAAPSTDSANNTNAAPHVDFDLDEVSSNSSPTATPPAAPKTAGPMQANPKSTLSTSTPKALAAQPGAVFVSTPGGGDVYERGRYLGHAPAQFLLSPGWHTLLVKSGGGDRTATVQVHAGAALAVNVPATKP